jgi:hypothetical protein
MVNKRSRLLLPNERCFYKIATDMLWRGSRAVATRSKHHTETLSPWTHTTHTCTEAST